MALPSFYSAVVMKAMPIATKTTPPNRTPSPEYVATRLHSIANCKLRLEASQHEPRLRKLLGHIFIYDAIREHQHIQPVPAIPTMSRRREQQLRRQRQSEEARQASLSPVSEDPKFTSTSISEHDPAFANSLPSKEIPPSSIDGFLAFQEAIESQLATLSQLRLENASRQLYSMTQDADDEDELAVAEFESNGDEADDTDYDSYDDDAAEDWRFEDEDDKTEDGDSDTDPDSVPSEPTSPLSEKALGCEPDLKLMDGTESYFPVQPMVYEVPC